MTTPQRITRLVSPALVLAALIACEGTTSSEVTSVRVGVIPDGTVFDAQVVEASCGLCQFDMGGHTCSLAVRYEGNVAFVDGTEIDEHGDAHAADGFCAVVRMATVSGEVNNGRLQVTSFELVDNDRHGGGHEEGH